jgi:peptidoglycan hydrolase-like protein with peptidoglycan-binding domain
MPDNLETTSIAEVLAITCRELRLTRPNTVGTDVSAVQQALIARGYSPGAVDGIFGPNTANAVAGFQAANGLPFTGNVCAQTYTLLGIDCVSVPPCTGPAACRVLMLTSPYMEGTDVRAVQQGLAARGFNPGAIDGLFGPDTQAAVIAFQRASRVEPTGIVCDALYEALGVYCPAYPACPATIICRVLRVTSPLTTGPDVIAVQEALLAAGFNPGAIDGAYGAQTETAARNFQTARGLAVTGVVCGETYVALGVSCQTVPACPVPPVITCRVLSVTSPFMSGSDVLAVQRALAAAGFSPGTADGVYGPSTANAVEQFQAARSIPITGQVCGQTYVLLGVNCQSVPACPAGPITCRVLQVTSPYMSGQDVYAVQHALVARGFSPGTVDGVYGPNTAAAVRAFQTANGLTVTGIVCDQTYVLLNVGCQSVPPCPPLPGDCRVLSTANPFMRGADVLAVQQVLRTQGFYAGALDGIYGPNTSTAVRNFQASRAILTTGNVCDGLYATLGIVCSSPPPCPHPHPIDTCRRLHLTSPLLHGSDVAAVQIALANRGFNPVQVDGIYGPNAVAAVLAFQTAAGLPVNGVVCSLEYRALFLNCDSYPAC